MARHSKNNTAGSVFTYGERQRLKQSNEWGEMHARIGGKLKNIYIKNQPIHKKNLNNAISV